MAGTRDSPDDLDAFLEEMSTPGEDEGERRGSQSSIIFNEDVPEVVSTNATRRSSASGSSSGVLPPSASLALQQAFAAARAITQRIEPDMAPPIPLDKFCTPWTKHDWLPLDDPLLSYKKFLFPVSITYHISPEMDDVDLFRCLELLERSSSAHYKASAQGWNSKEKEKEMSNKDMMYLVVREAGNLAMPRTKGEIIGFLSFMYTYDDPPHEKRPVIYIYEIHLDLALRGHGLGSHLITIAETVAKRSGIRKTMLTVFTANRKALHLYQRLGYEKDECSPEDTHLRTRTVEAEYKILSKQLEPSDEDRVFLERKAAQMGDWAVYALGTRTITEGEQMEE